MSCGVGRRRGSDLAWLWLWYRLAATALIQPLAWECPYAAGMALKRQKKKKKRKKKTIYICLFNVNVFLLINIVGFLIWDISCDPTKKEKFLSFLKLWFSVKKESSET